MSKPAQPFGCDSPCPDSISSVLSARASAYLSRMFPCPSVPLYSLLPKQRREPKEPEALASVHPPSEYACLCGTLGRAWLAELSDTSIVAQGCPASNVDLKTGGLCHWNLARLELKSQPSQPGSLAHSSGSLASCLKVSLPIPETPQALLGPLLSSPFKYFLHGPTHPQIATATSVLIVIMLIEYILYVRHCSRDCICVS